MSALLPARWTEAALEDVVTVSRDRADPRAFPIMPFIGMDNVEPHTMRLLGTVPAGTMRSSAIHFFPHDVLYGRLRPYLNKLLSPTFEGLASAEFIPLTPKPGIDSGFIRYRLNAADFVAFASHLDEGDRPRVDWNGIRNFRISVPPTAEQRRIVDAIDSYLSRLDDAGVNLQRARLKLEAFRASVLNAALTGRLVPRESSLARAEKRGYEPSSVLLERILHERRRRWEEMQLRKFREVGQIPRDDRWKAKYEEPVAPRSTSLPQLPEGWCWATIDQLCAEITDGDHQPPPVCDQGIPFLVIGNVRTGRISFSGCRRVPPDYYNRLDDKRRPDSRDLLYTVVGSVGIPVRIDDDRQFCVQRHIAILKAPHPEIKEYLLRALASGFVLNQASMLATGTAQKTVGLGSLRRIVIPLPPATEVRRLVPEVDRLLSTGESAAVAIGANVKRTHRLRQAILKWAFEGRLVAQNPADAPAEELLAQLRAEGEASVPVKRSRLSRRRLR